MGIMRRLFGNHEKSARPIASVLKETQNKLFDACNVAKPSEAQRVKASFYLCVLGTASLSMGGKTFYPCIDELFEETKARVAGPLTFRVNELATSTADLAELLAYFPKNLEITASTKVNGLCALEALFEGRFEKLRKDITDHDRGLGASAPYAGYVVAEGIFGKEQARTHAIPISLVVSTFALELVKAAGASLQLKKAR